MYIDKKRILESKIPETSETLLKFKALKENNTAENQLDFVSHMRNQTIDGILENSMMLYPFDSGIEFLKESLENHNLTEHQLYTQKESIEEFIKRVGTDHDMISHLNECVSSIDTKLSKMTTPEATRRNTKLRLAEERFKDTCLYEAYLDPTFDIVINNINHDPRAIDDFEKAIRKIKLSKDSTIVGTFPDVLKKVGTLILTLKVSVTGQVLNLIVSVPEVLAKKMIEFNVSSKQAKSFIKVIDNHLKDLYALLRDTAGEYDYVLMTSYMEALHNAKRRLDDYASAIITESIQEMGPIVGYSDGVVEDISMTIDDEITDLFDALERDDVKEAFYVLDRLDKLHEYCNTVVQSDAEPVTEDAITKATGKMADAGRKTVNKVKKGAANTKRIKTAIKKVTDPFINMIDDTVNKIKEMDAAERRNRVVTGQLRFKLFNLLRKGIRLIVLGKVSTVLLPSLAGPLVSLIAIITSIAIDKKLDDKTRRTILKELEGELHIVKEKIEDAKGDNNKQAKYELMRIQQKLEADIERIRYHLD